jgi:pyruvate ferredoxin oxidoreductase delta subunit
VLAGLSPEKIDPQLLEDEIGRLLHLAEITLETGVALDFRRLGEGVPEADFIILDPTGFSEGNAFPAGIAEFDPFTEGPPDSRIVSAKLPENLEQFKPSLIAHYIGAGRQTAIKVLDMFAEPSGQPGISGPNPQRRQVVNAEDIRLERFQSSDHSGPAKGKEEKWEWERVFEETKRCLSCGACNQCLQCATFCPDASIRPDETAVTVDLEHCKGCGICAYECPRGVITMEAVSS